MRGLAVWLEDRNPPVFATVVMVVAVMAFSLLGHVVLHGGQGGLLAPSDLWSLAGSSSAILHGDFAHVYIRHGALTSPPAFEIALAPVMALGQLVGLSPHHRAAGEALSLWLVLGPAAVLLASTALFAFDAAARAWRFSEQRRLALALVGGLGVANVAGYWGHPEDCMALAFVLWAALSMERSDSAGATRAALLLGIGIAFQPLALLAVAPILARLTWRRAARLVGWLVLPSLVVLAGPLLAETHRTLFVLVRQPFQLKWVSLTPLTSLASHLAPGLDGGGPTRLVAILVASGLAIVVCHRRHDLPTVLTMVAGAFFLRILLETEMNWYYLWPVAALCLLLALRRGSLRFAVCSLALAASVALGDRRVHDIALWWPALMATAVVMLLCAAPPPRRWATGASGRPPAGATTRPVECTTMRKTVAAGGRRE